MTTTASTTSTTTAQDIYDVMLASTRLYCLMGEDLKDFHFGVYNKAYLLMLEQDKLIEVAALAADKLYSGLSEKEFSIFDTMTNELCFFSDKGLCLWWKVRELANVEYDCREEFEYCILK